MEEKLFAIETATGRENDDLEKLLLLVDPKQRSDVKLRRLLLFRLRLDGFDTTRHYLVEKTRAADRCRFTGSLYDYLKDDVIEQACQDSGDTPDP